MHEYVAQRGRKSGVRALPAPHTLAGAEAGFASLLRG